MTEPDDQVSKNGSPERNRSPEADEASALGHGPDHEPRRVRVPTDHDAFGRPINFVEADVDAAGAWDDSRWSAHPPV